MKKFACYRLRAWEARTGRIRNYWTWKNSVVLGSDSKSDFCLKDLTGFDLRVHFVEQKIYKISSAEFEDFPSNKIHQTECYAFQWSPVKLPQKSKDFLLGIGLAIAGLTFLVGYSWLSGKKESCAYEESQLATGRWKRKSGENPIFRELLLLEGAFHSALKEGDLVKAKLELEAARNLIQSKTKSEACHPERALLKWEELLSKRIILKSLQAREWLAAARNLSQLPKELFNLRQFFEKQILRSVRDQYFEAYRLEEDDPERSMEMLENLNEICESLGRESDCYRAS